MTFDAPFFSIINTTLTEDGAIFTDGGGRTVITEANGDNIAVSIFDAAPGLNPGRILRTFTITHHDNLPAAIFDAFGEAA